MSHTRTTPLRPLHDRVLVKRIDGNAKRGSIVVPNAAQEKPHEGEVVAVGAGRIIDDGRHLAPAVKRGDRILFGRYSGSEVTLDGEEFLIMKEEDVLGILGVPGRDGHRA